MDKNDLKKMLEEIHAEEVAEKQKAEKVSSDINDLAEKIGEKIVNAISTQKGGIADKDKQELKETYFSPRSGMKGFVYPELDKLSSLSKDEKIVAFFKALTEKDKSAQADAVFKALVEGTDDQGGYMVPEELRTEVFRIMPDYAVMRKIALIMPMHTDTLDFTTLTAAPSAYWTAEYGSKTTTSAEFGRVILNAADLVCLLPVTHQLIADANINVVQLIIQLFAETLGTAEDKAFFTGSGTNQPKGISQESLTSVSAGGAPTFDHFMRLMYLVPQSVRSAAKAAFVMSSYAASIARQIKDSQNRYIWESSVQVGAPDRLFGKPVYEQNDIAQSHVYFGDWTGYVIGDRQTMTVETTTVGGEAWRRNAMEIKAVERVDGTTLLTSKFAKMTNLC